MRERFGDMPKMSTELHPWLSGDGAGVARRDEADEEPAGVAARPVAVLPAKSVLVLGVNRHHAEYRVTHPAC